MKLRHFCFVLVLSGCTLGPDFSAPNPELPSSWSNRPPENSVFVDQAISPANWWSEFKDALLSDLIARGTAGNLDLKIAAERVRQARELVTVSASTQYPSLGAGASARRSDSSRESGSDSAIPGAGGGSAARNLFSAGFDALWELDIFGGNRRAVEAAEAALRSAQHDQANVLITVAGDIGVSYVTIRSLQQRIIVAEGTLESQRRSERIAEKRVSAGFANSLDLANARTQAFLTEAQIPQLHAELEAQQNALAVLLGLAVEGLPAEVRANQALPTLPASIPLHSPLNLLRRRPDILRAEADLHAATAQIGVAIADLFPAFSLSAFFGVEGDKARALTEWHNNLWSVAGSATAPILEGGRLRANVEIQRSARAAAFFAYERTVLSALAEVETALADYQSELVREKSLAHAVVSSRTALGISTKLYSDGLSEFLNVLEAQRSYYASQQALLLSRQAALIDAIRIYKAFGGGWAAPPHP